MVLSQRDPRWAQIPLGTSSLTIGQAGCTITCLAMVIGTTPDVVNERLKAVGGFKDGNLVIWAKVAEAFPGVTCQRAWTYNNDEVLTNLPVVVQVDGSPIGAQTHFVVYIGNQQMYDPWTGTTELTSKYAPQSYAIVKGTWQQSTIDVESGLDLTNVESMRIAARVWKRFTDGELVEKTQFQAQLDATNQCQTQLKTALDQASEYQKQLDSYNKQVAEYKLQLEEVRKKYDDEQKLVLSLKDEITKIHQSDKDYGQEALDAQHLANDRGDYLHMIADQLNVQYDPGDDKKLVDEVLGEIAGRQKKDAPDDKLHGILKELNAMGMNNYLQEAKGLSPVSETDPDLIEKVATYLGDVTNELLAKRQPSVTYTTSTGATTYSIPIVKKKKSLRSFLRPIINLFFMEVQQ